MLIWLKNSQKPHQNVSAYPLFSYLAMYLTLLQLLKERLELLVDPSVFHLDHLVHLLQVLVLQSKLDFIINSREAETLCARSLLGGATSVKCSFGAHSIDLQSKPLNGSAALLVKI